MSHLFYVKYFNWFEKENNKVSVCFYENDTSSIKHSFPLFPLPTELAVMIFDCQVEPTSL